MPVRRLSVPVANSDTNWHHYAVTYDGSLVRLYFDGQPAGSGSLTGLTGKVICFPGVTGVGTGHSSHLFERVSCIGL